MYSLCLGTRGHTGIYLASLLAPLSETGECSRLTAWLLIHYLISRGELIRAGVHAQNQAGIHGDPKDGGGAFSICISEGYEDNEDLGDRMYVTLPPSGATRPHCYLQHLCRRRYAVCNDSTFR